VVLDRLAGSLAGGGATVDGPVSGLVLVGLVSAWSR